MSHALRIRTGIAQDAEGWWVMQQIGDSVSRYGPSEGTPFATEAEAWEAAQKAARAVREKIADTPGVNVR